MTTVEAFPLHWPAGRSRTKVRKRAPFHRKTSEHNPQYNTTQLRNTRLSIEESQSRVRRELELLGGAKVIISSNLELRQDGLPRSGQRQPEDPGVAGYFHLKAQPHCLSCDTWDRAADNLAAIAKHVEAMRGQIRWGVGDVAAMFAGFRALPGAIITPAAMDPAEARQFMARWGLGTGFTPAQLADAYRNAAKELHPDANGGTHRPDWDTLQRAMEVLRQPMDE